MSKMRTHDILIGSLAVAIPNYVWFPELKVDNIVGTLDDGGTVRVLHVPSGWTDYVYSHYTVSGVTTTFYALDWRGFMGNAEPIGSICYVYLSACLRNAPGDKLTEVWAGGYPHLHPYADYDIDVSTCPGRIPSAAPAWDGSLPYKPIGAGHVFWWLPGWSGAPARSVSGIGLNLAELNYNHDVANKWCLRIYLANTGWPFVGLAFEGQKDCDDSNPAGIYTKTAGCANNASLSMGVDN